MGVSVSVSVSVSVILPIYNGAATLARAIDSILNQNYDALELVLVNDGSTQPIEHVIAPYLSDGRVKYFGKPNGGVASARNFGIQRSSGEFVAFCDQDDVWLPNKLSAQVPLFADDSVALIYGWLYGDKNGARREIRREIEGACFDRILADNFIACCTAIVRRKTLEEIGGFDEDRVLSGCDEWLVWLKTLSSYRLAVAREPVAIFFLHGDNYSLNESRMLAASLACIAKIKTFLTMADKPVDEALFQSALRNNYLHYAANLRHQGHYRDASAAYRAAWKIQRTDLYSLLNSALLMAPKPILESAHQIKQSLQGKVE